MLRTFCALRMDCNDSDAAFAWLKQARDLGLVAPGLVNEVVLQAPIFFERVFNYLPLCLLAIRARTPELLMYNKDPDQLHEHRLFVLVPHALAERGPALGVF